MIEPMAKRDIICGIDVGSSSIRTIIAQLVSTEEKPRIIGVGIADSSGVRKGVIVDIEETLRSIADSVEKAERSAGVTVERAVVSI
ncbi:MAG: cell division protein FtsA, partial [Candidatus Pacebacteria bacterium]|nr:cell division protein FtsA [Candidatus Paceibacterota bacterium]